MSILTLVLSILVPLLILLGVTFYIQAFLIQSKADEWLLVLRDGKVVKQGVGITYVKRLGDNIVKFPSIIHTVEFSAEQTTQEKQGIQIQGVIIW